MKKSKTVVKKITSAILFSLILIFSDVGCKTKKSEATEAALQQPVGLQNNLIEGPTEVPDENAGDAGESDFSEFSDYASEEEKIARALEELKNIQNTENSSDLPDAKLMEYTDKDDFLSFSEFDSEIVDSDYDENRRVMIYVIGNSVIRCFYDDSARLTQKELWTISGVKNSKINETEFYEYKEDSLKPFYKKKVSQNRQEDFYFLEDGNVQKHEVFKFVDSKKYPLKLQVWTFNSEGKIARIFSENYEYESEESKKNTRKTTSRYEYSYNKNAEIEPDLKYYEDNILKIYTKYSDKKGSYVSEVFFDNAFSVVTTYEDYAKKKETYIQNRKVVREKIYE